MQILGNVPPKIDELMSYSKAMAAGRMTSICKKDIPLLGLKTIL